MKKIFLLLIILLISSCSSYTPKDTRIKYTKLSKDLDVLMDDEISEKKRYDLEKKFVKFYDGMVKYKEDNIDEDTSYLDRYLKEIKIKIQYLKDLKDD